VICVAVLTAEVDTVNVAELEPEGIVTPEGLVADVEELLESETNTPPVGANPFMPTVPTAEFPPMMLEGFTLKDDTDKVGGGVATAPPPPPAHPFKKVPSEQKTNNSNRRPRANPLAG
jgi:hypothetical protein